MPTSDEVWQVLLAAFPEPEDLDAYVPALYYSQMADALFGLARVYKDAFSDAVFRIRKDGLTSERYAVVEHFRENRRVRLEMVREDHPDVYAELVHLDGRTAQAILGASALFAQCVDAVVFRRVLAEEGSFDRVARKLGCGRTSVRRAAEAHGVRSPYFVVPKFLWGRG